MVDPATTSACRQSSAIAALEPLKGVMASRRFSDRTAAFARRALAVSSSRSITSSKTSSLTGFVRNCSAPSLTAATAISIDPNAVSTTTGTFTVRDWRARRTSSALPSGSL